jgi:hypothetical protein
MGAYHRVIGVCDARPKRRRDHRWRANTERLQRIESRVLEARDVVEIRHPDQRRRELRSDLRCRSNVNHTETQSAEMLQRKRERDEDRAAEE